MTQPENPMPMRPYRLVFSVPDRDGNEVRLTEGQWEGHILDKRPVMEPYIEEIKAVIGDPQVIVADESGDEIHFWTLGVAPGRTHQYLKVIVAYSDEVTGRRIGSVRTAYFTGRRPKGRIIYERETSRG